MSEGRCFHERVGVDPRARYERERTYVGQPVPAGTCNCVEANAHAAGAAAANARWREAVARLRTNAAFYSGSSEAFDSLLRALGEEA